MADFPSMKWRDFKRVLERRPLDYHVDRQRGSHVKMISTAGHPTLRLAFHDRATLAPGLIRSILVKNIGLDEDEALALLD